MSLSRIYTVLFLDYGYHEPFYFDPRSVDSRLKVFSNHKMISFDVAQAGQVDLTFPVNWTHVQDIAKQHGLKEAAFGCMTDFLIELMAYSIEAVYTT